LNLNKNADISIFLKIEGKDISSQISLEFTFTYRKTNIYKGFKTAWLMVETIFGIVKTQTNSNF